MKKKRVVKFSGLIPRYKVAAKTPEDYQIWRHVKWWKDCIEDGSQAMRNLLLNELEAEMRESLLTGDATFFKRLAHHIEKWKEPDRLKEWLIEIHMPRSDGLPKFTQDELVLASKKAGLFPMNRQDDSVLTALKREMKKLRFKWKNSPGEQV